MKFKAVFGQLFFWIIILKTTNGYDENSGIIGMNRCFLRTFL